MCNISPWDRIVYRFRAEVKREVRNNPARENSRALPGKSLRLSDNLIPIGSAGSDLAGPVRRASRHATCSYEHRGLIA